MHRNHYLELKQDCLDALQRAQEPLSGPQIQEATGHDCSEGSQLAEHLAKNPKIGLGDGKYRFKVIFSDLVFATLFRDKCDNGRCVYKFIAEVIWAQEEVITSGGSTSHSAVFPDFKTLIWQAAADVKVLDQRGALKFIERSKGCLLRDLTAAYPAAPEDLAKMKADGLIWILPSSEKEQEAVFMADHPPLIDVSLDVMKLWHQIEVCLLVKRPICEGHETQIKPATYSTDCLQPSQSLLTHEG